MIGFLCALPIIGGLLGGCGPADAWAAGYVEGDYVHLAPVAAAELVEVTVVQGDRVAVGDVVARQERTDAEIALAEAKAVRAEAEAELANLREGSRPEEIRVIEAAIAAGRVRSNEAERAAERQSALADRGVVSASILDHALAERDLAATELAEREAELAVARLPAREGLVHAAESRLRGAAATERAAAWRLDKRTLAAPVEGEITDVFRRVGELAGPTSPVVSILPEGATRLVAYVGEATFSGLRPGDLLAVRCDGCPSGLKARVSYVADSPEFTPPVIYSVETRQKLVYRIEATPEAGARALRPGQIVDVARVAP